MDCGVISYHPERVYFVMKTDWMYIIWLNFITSKQFLVSNFDPRQKKKQDQTRHNVKHTTYYTAFRQIKILIVEIMMNSTPHWTDFNWIMKPLPSKQSVLYLFSLLVGTNMVEFLNWEESTKPASKSRLLQSLKNVNFTVYIL